MVLPPPAATREPARFALRTPRYFSQNLEGFSKAPLHPIARPLILLLVLVLQAPNGAAAQTRDVAGARDFPGIGRFAGSVITGYQMKDFDAARMQGAVFKDGKPADARRLEGKVTR